MYSCRKIKEEKYNCFHSDNIFSSSFLLITFIATRMASLIVFVWSVKSPHRKLADVTGSLSSAKSTFLLPGKTSLSLPTWRHEQDLFHLLNLRFYYKVKPLRHFQHLVRPHVFFRVGNTENKQKRRRSFFNSQKEL